MDLGRLGIGHVERREKLTDGRLVAECRRVDSAGSRFVALRLGVELLALSLELLDLRGRVSRATLEVLLGLPGCAEVTPQLLDLRLPVEGEHRPAGVLLLAA